MEYEIDKAVVTMSNALVRAGHSLTLSEKRLVAIAISKLDTKGGPGRYGLGFEIDCKITAEEYAELAQCEMQTAYRDLNNASRRLRKSGIEFFEPDNKRKGAPLVVRVNMSWVTTTKYHTKQGWVELTWNHKLVPHLLGLKREFTSYKLNQMAALRSVYSHRLLELLMMFECTGWAKFSLMTFVNQCKQRQLKRKTLRIFAENH